MPDAPVEERHVASLCVQVLWVLHAQPTRMMLVNLLVMLAAALNTRTLVRPDDSSTQCCHSRCASVSKLDGLSDNVALVAAKLYYCARLECICVQIQVGLARNNCFVICS